MTKKEEDTQGILFTAFQLSDSDNLKDYIFDYASGVVVAPGVVVSSGVVVSPGVLSLIHI